MKTLNRPMFRYGGPIKEGVMNGIREPKRNGGSMGINTPKRGLVDGPGSYAGFLAPLIPAAIAAGRFAIRPLVKYGSNVLRKVGDGKVLRKGSTFIDAAGKKVKSSGKFSKVKPVFDKDQKTLTAAGRYFANSPEANLVTGAGGAISRGIYNTGKYAVKSPLTLASAAGFGGKKLYDALNAEPDKKDPAGVTAINKLKQSIGMPENLTLGGGQNYEGDPPKELTDAEREQIESDNRMKQMDKYKEILDIKGMNKDAAYKSLTDASKIIQEGGNLKEQLKDGSLIQKITAAASKRFDKVSDTETALRSLIAKGEIDKEMNKEKNQLDNAVKNAQLKAYNKQNEGLSTGEMIQKRLQTAKGEFPQGDELRKIISLNNPELNAKTLPSGDIPTNVDALDYIIGQVAAVNADPKTGDYPDGVYVIKDRIIQVLEGEVIPISVNQLK